MTVGGGTMAYSTTETQLKSRRKAAKMLVAVVVMFAACYFPVHLLDILRFTIDVPQNKLTSTIAMISHWLCYANSAVNPIIYNIMSGKISSPLSSPFPTLSFIFFILKGNFEKNSNKRSDFGVAAIRNK